jgi:hypothetical protein
MRSGGGGGSGWRRVLLVRCVCVCIRCVCVCIRCVCVCIRCVCVCSRVADAAYADAAYAFACAACLSRRHGTQRMQRCSSGSRPCCVCVCIRCLHTAAHADAAHVSAYAVLRMRLGAGLAAYTAMRPCDIRRTKYAAWQHIYMCARLWRYTCVRAIYMYTCVYRCACLNGCFADADGDGCKRIRSVRAFVRRSASRLLYIDTFFPAIFLS